MSKFLTNFKAWISEHKGFLIQTFILLLLCGGTIVYVHEKTADKEELPYQLWIAQHKADGEYYKAKEDLANEVDSFIHVIAPNSALNGLAIVEACDEYDVDIRFVLAQGWKESHYGTTGIAAKNNGVFNVGASDGKSAEAVKIAGYHYKHPDQSVRPYLQLLRDDYIPDGGTELDLFKKFVNHNGKRYASDPNYENSLIAHFDTITVRTTILPRMQHYHKCKIAAGR